jgi:phosphoglycerol transferase MdoB-like AlkP superfamily enzyme
MRVSQAVKNAIREMHSSIRDNTAFRDSIQRVVVFVMESTPAALVQPYDSVYQVTPNINKWSKHARIYSNIYAHLPNTINSMFSMVSGMYPLVSYKSVVKEYPHFSSPSLFRILENHGWNTSVFFSSDLAYSNIDGYLKSQGVEKAEDYRSIHCSYPALKADYAMLSGLDDRCVVDRYLEWSDSLKAAKTLSILWTNQTHYPYVLSGSGQQYVKDQSLNVYLNALREDDAAFGQLMDGLANRKMLEKTLVVVVGDHGEAFGTHGQTGHASNIYDENLHVPCLLINPRLFQGEHDERIGGMIDIAPTIATIAHVPATETWEGSSLLGNKQRSHSFFLGPFSDFQFGSRFDNWKLIYNGSANNSKLFDLSKDPGELKNVAEQNKQLVARELEIIAGWVQYHTELITPYLHHSRSN